MSSIIQGTERVFLAKFTSIDAPSQPSTELPPATPSNGASIENLYSFNIGPTSIGPENEIRQARFQLCEVEITFTGADSWTSVVVYPYMSRLNPAPLNYGTATEIDVDTWGTFGGQTIYKVGGTSGGNRFRFAAACAKYLMLWAGGGSGGSGTRHVDANLYGIIERHGGIS